MVLSVIVPVYNSEKYISDCVNSILNQTYSNIEVILVDDGSVDKSGNICDWYEKHFKNIKVIHQNNSGVSKARNTGLDVAKGDIISFVDSDDTIDKDMYEVLVSLLVTYQLDIAHCSYKRIVNDKTFCIGDTKELLIQEKNEAIDFMLNGEKFEGAIWNKVYRKEILASVRFNEELRINEDILFNVQAFNNSQRIGYIDDSKYNYIVRENSSVTNTADIYSSLKDSLYVSRYVYEHFDDKTIKTTAKNRYVMSLCAFFRVADKSERKRIKGELKRINTVDLRRNLKISLYLIRCVPSLYALMYRLYDKIRVPEWDRKSR